MNITDELKEAEQTFIGKTNAAVLSLLDGYMHYLYKQYKRPLFRNHPKTVVEIGSGCEANMRYLRPGTRLYAVEPNTYMHKTLNRKAYEAKVNLSIITGSAEQLPFETGSLPFVVSTLVLCTVDSPPSIISEILRVLKPGGLFVFVEHVVAKESPLLRAVQKWTHRPWHWFLDGCRTSRDTGHLIRSSGFSVVISREINVYSPFIPMIPHIGGMARK
ncbi:MAG: class I SAM-dependent methyltransferase [Balneolaceae bacterium]|nr:class I SAM-dependent methyltransferase [Balneolaceae bacterium]